MKTMVVWFTTAVVVGLVCQVTPSRGATGSDSPLRETSEVISLLKSNYVDRDKLNEKWLNEATVSGLVKALGRGVTIVDSLPTNATTVTETTNASVLARAEIIEPEIGYVRLLDVTDQVPAALDAELAKFAAAKVSGFVLDLRFADGTNYAAAAAVAGRFLNDSRELLILKRSGAGDQVFHATFRNKPLTSNEVDLASAPLMLLVNSETRGSAEALAAALRAQDRGIVIGSQTAGSAARWEEVKLSDGRFLRVATAKIVVPPGINAVPSADIFPNGITPDVAVKVSPATERETVFVTETNGTLTASLRPRLKKKDLTEAQLVRAFHGQSVDGDEPSADGKEHEDEGEIQNVRDVVLQRAVDVLKGIRVSLSAQQ